MLEYGLIPPAMFAAMLIALLPGFPVGFTLAAVGLLFAVLGMALGQFEHAFLLALPARFQGILSNDLLLSIPFFTFMGAILERCRLAEDLLESCGKLFGRFPGGLAVAVVLVGALLGAVTGTVAASVIAMAVISLPAMIRYGYDMRLATGVIAASGTITQLIPPSLVLIILADQLGTTVGDMYLGALGPSLLQVMIFLLFLVGVAIFRPQKMPPLPKEVVGERGWRLLGQVLLGSLPTLGLIFLVLGTIFMGLATPTESGAMGAVGAILIAAAHGRLRWALVREAMGSTTRTTSMVVFLLIGATIFTLVFQGMNGSKWIEHMLSHLPGGQIGFLIFVNVFVFILAFFLDFFEIAFIVIPLLAPVAVTLGVDLVWFGVLLCVNMQTSFMHPPFGVALFYLRGVAPETVKTSDIYLGAIPWVGMQLLLVAVVIIWPESVTSWVPKTNTAPAESVERSINEIELPTAPANSDLNLLPPPASQPAR